MFFGTQSSSYIIAENLKIVNWFLHFSMEIRLQFFCRNRKHKFNAMQSIASWETFSIWFGKAGAHPQLALGIAIAPETMALITTFQFLRQLRFFRFSLRFLFHLIVQFSIICFANVGCSPTPRQHFWKIVGSKNFYFACGIWYITHFEKQKQKKPWFQQLKVCWNQGKKWKIVG